MAEEEMEVGGNEYDNESGEIQKERQILLLEKKSMEGSVVIGDFQRERLVVEQKEHAIQPEGNWTQKIHSEWTSVHDKIAHKEEKTKKPREQLDKEKYVH